MKKLIASVFALGLLASAGAVAPANAAIVLGIGIHAPHHHRVCGVHYVHHHRVRYCR